MAKWAEISNSILTRACQVYTLGFCMKFHVEGKTGSSAHNIFKPPVTERTINLTHQWRGRNLRKEIRTHETSKSSCHNMNSTKRKSSLKSPITCCYHRIQHTCALLLRRLGDLQLSQDPGACGNHPLNSLSGLTSLSPRVSHSVCAVAHFVVSEAFGSPLRSQFSICKIQNRFTKKQIILKYISIHRPLGGQWPPRKEIPVPLILRALLVLNFPPCPLQFHSYLLTGLFGICYKNLKCNIL